MYEIEKIEEALYYSETVFVTDGTYTVMVDMCDVWHDRIDLLLSNGQWMTIYDFDFYNGISVLWYEQDNAWIIAPDWWHGI